MRYRVHGVSRATGAEISTTIEASCRDMAEAKAQRTLVVAEIEDPSADGAPPTVSYALVPWLYLKGISTGEMSDALVHLDFDGTGLSAASVTRMTEAGQGEYQDWSKRDPSGKHYAYLWADRTYFGCRLSDDRTCVMVLMGATVDGTKLDKLPAGQQPVRL